MTGPLYGTSSTQNFRRGFTRHVGALTARLVLLGNSKTCHPNPAPNPPLKLTWGKPTSETLLISLVLSSDVLGCGVEGVL